MVKLDTALNEFWELVADVYLKRWHEGHAYSDLTGWVNATEHIN